MSSSAAKCSAPWKKYVPMLTVSTFNQSQYQLQKALIHDINVYLRQVIRFLI